MIKLVVTVLGLFGVWKWVTTSAEGPGLPLSMPDSAQYWLALKYETDPAVLKDLAAKFRSKGYNVEAAALAARASLPSQSATVHGDHAAIVQGCFRSTRPEGIHKVSIGFERAGKGATAKALRHYARGLRVHQMVQPMPAPQPPPPPMPATMHGDPQDQDTGEGHTNVQHGTEGTDEESAPNDYRGEDGQEYK